MEFEIETDFEEDISESEDDFELVIPETSFDSSEEEDNDEEITNQNQTENVINLACKNNDIVWSSIAPTLIGRTSTSNIIKNVPGPTSYATARATTIKETFLLYFPPPIEKIILDMTNKEGAKIYGEKWINIDYVDLHGYIGLMILAGVYRSNHESLLKLWDDKLGRPIFRATMSLEKFKQLSRVIRFDDKDTRQNRKTYDKLAPIRDIWNLWVEILPKLYNPGYNVTVDEQLIPFRGRCPFRQYIPSKPARYGIKTWVVCDSKSSYAWNMQVYTGKIGDKPEKNQGCRVVLDLTFALRGQNVTCDNFFTSYNLGQMLLKRNLTMLGTIRKNKPEIPTLLTQVKNVPVHTSRFAFSNNTTILSYVPKKYKNVLLISTLHKTDDISNRADKKPLMILDYNKTKGAVDTLDQVVASYSCKRRTARWPVAIFSNIVDVSAYNSFVIWCEIFPNYHKNKTHKRRIFLEELGLNLIEPLIRRRETLPRGPSAKNIVLEYQTDTPSSETESQPSTSSAVRSNQAKRGRCNICPRKSDTKYHIRCEKCNNFACKQHLKYFCTKCST